MIRKARRINYVYLIFEQRSYVYVSIKDLPGINLYLLSVRIKYRLQEVKCYDVSHSIFENEFIFEISDSTKMKKNDTNHVLFLKSLTHKNRRTIRRPP